MDKRYATPTRKMDLISLLNTSIHLRISATASQTIASSLGGEEHPRHCRTCKSIHYIGRPLAQPPSIMKRYTIPFSLIFVMQPFPPVFDPNEVFVCHTSKRRCIRRRRSRVHEGIR